MPELKNLVITGKITNTSNKKSDAYKSENPTKAVYITPYDDINKQLMIDFGIRLYTPKNNENEEHFIIRSAQNLKVYCDGEIIDTLNTRLDGKLQNFKVDKNIKINIIKGENVGNIFYRVQAILVDQIEDIEFNEPSNPFV